MEVTSIYVILYLAQTLLNWRRKTLYWIKRLDANKNKPYIFIIWYATK